MIKFSKYAALSIVYGVFWLVGVQPGLGASTLPSFREVYELLSTNLTGTNLPSLEYASVEGLLKLLGPRVELVQEQTNAECFSTASPLARTNLFDGSIAYFRVSSVTAQLPAVLQAALQVTASTNKLTGMVLDLRFAHGTDYAAAAAVADLFVDSADVILDWGTGKAIANPKTNAIRLPVIALVNHETAGAAEALAALVQHLGIGVVIGTNTAGRIFTVTEFELSTGQRIRVATGQVTLGTGQPLPVDGVHPDIVVVVKPEDERAFLADPYKQITPVLVVTGQTGVTVGQNGGLTQTNRVQRRRFNEADLVREHMESLRPFRRQPTTRFEEPETPVVTDPALARALDLIKGLAVLRQAQDQ